MYPWAVELTKKHEEVHWVEDEAELSEDVQDWKTKLTIEEKEFITQVLRLFTHVQVGESYD
jgi:ribonucleoside-diphosphate reductase beta chain